PTLFLHRTFHHKPHTPRLFQNVTDRNPIHSRRLQRDGAIPALCQPLGHLLQLGGSAAKASHRLGVAARRYGYIVGFIADINAGSVRMHHLQVKIFALHLAHHLPPLLAVHLLPLARRWLATGFLALLLVFRGSPRCLAFHANLLGLNSTWARPGRRNLHNLSIGVRALILIQDNPATIFTIANTGAMLSVGQKRSKDIAALAAEQVVLRF